MNDGHGIPQLSSAAKYLSLIFLMNQFIVCLQHEVSEEAASLTCLHTTGCDIIDRKQLWETR